MILSNPPPLISICIMLLVANSCRFSARQQELSRQTSDHLLFESETIIISHDGRTYSKHKNRVIFSISPDQVSYLYQVGNTYQKKNFTINSSKMINNQRYYYAEDVNNIFVLDERMAMLKIYGANREGNGFRPHAGHTFLNLRPINDINEQRLFVGHQ